MNKTTRYKKIQMKNKSLLNIIWPRFNLSDALLSLRQQSVVFNSWPLFDFWRGDRIWTLYDWTRNFIKVFEI